MGAARRREVDGVPVFHAPGPEPFEACLVFRVGQSDETLPTRGWTHLIEHLALTERFEDRVRHNGAVDQTTTVFHATGTPEEVGTFLTTVVRTLADLPYDQLDTELGVLRAEDARRNASLHTLPMSLRFGPHGHGLVAYPELGLHAATPEQLEAWRLQWFTRGNAAVWCSGEPPETLDLSSLPDGERRPPREPEPLGFPMPSWYGAFDDVVGVSMIGHRDTALSTGMGLLERRLFRRLRKGEGRSYDVASSYDRWTRDAAGLLVFADAGPGEAEAVRDAMMGELGSFARDGATAEELAFVSGERERADQDPHAGVGRAVSAAYETLLADRVFDDAELDAEYDAMTGEDVGAALARAAATALWLVPRSIGVDDRRLERLPSWSEGTLEGVEHKPVKGTRKEIAAERLIVSDEGVAVRSPQGNWNIARFDTLRAVQAFADGARTLWAQDGVVVFLHPGSWAKAAAVPDHIDSRVGPERVVRSTDASGYDPAADLEPGGLLGRLRKRR